MKEVLSRRSYWVWPLISWKLSAWKFYLWRSLYRLKSSSSTAVILLSSKWSSSRLEGKSDEKQMLGMRKNQRNDLTGICWNSCYIPNNLFPLCGVGWSVLKEIVLRQRAVRCRCVTFSENKTAKFVNIVWFEILLLWLLANGLWGKLLEFSE